MPGTGLRIRSRLRRQILPPQRRAMEPKCAGDSWGGCVDDRLSGVTSCRVAHYGQFPLTSRSLRWKVALRHTAHSKSSKRRARFEKFSSPRDYTSGASSCPVPFLSSPRPTIVGATDASLHILEDGVHSKPKPAFLEAAYFGSSGSRSVQEDHPPEPGGRYRSGNGRPQSSRLKRIKRKTPVPNPPLRHRRTATPSSRAA